MGFVVKSAVAADTLFTDIVVGGVILEHGPAIVNGHWLRASGGLRAHVPSVLVDGTTGEKEGEEGDGEGFHCMSTPVLQEVDLDLDGLAVELVVVHGDSVTYAAALFMGHQVEGVLDC